jgi:hypothetical protein
VSVRDASRVSSWCEYEDYERAFTDGWLFEEEARVSTSVCTSAVVVAWAGGS